MPDYIQNPLQDEVMASIVEHLKFKYRLTQDRCIYAGQDFSHRIGSVQAAPSVDLYVVSHGADDLCAMTAHGEKPITPVAFATRLRMHRLPTDRPIRIKLAMCFGNTPKPLEADATKEDSFARQVAVTLARLDRFGADKKFGVGTFHNVLVGGFDGEIQWAREKAPPDASHWQRDAKGRIVSEDRHAPNIKGKGKGNRTYFSVWDGGKPFVKPPQGFTKGVVFCYFPFNYPTK